MRPTLLRSPWLLLLPVLQVPVLLVWVPVASAQGLPTSPPPPLSPPPLPGVAQVLPVETQRDPQLEEALRQHMFNGPFDLVPGRQPDPDATEWQQARTLGRRPACGEVGDLRYLHNRVDLNGDGIPEIVAAVVGSYACGSRGCSLYVFRRQLSGPELVTEADLFESPLLIDGSTSFGWLNLSLPVALSLGAAPGSMLQLRFDGRTYGRAAEPPGPIAPGRGTVLLQMEPVAFEQQGLPLRCTP